MSITFVPPEKRPTDSPYNTTTVQKMLEENSQLIQTIYDCQLKGRMTECVEYQKILHRNIVYLAKLVDLSSNVPASVATQEIQMGSSSVDHVTLVNSSGHSTLGTVSNQSCQQGRLQMQGRNLIDHQSLLPLEQPPTSAMPPCDYGQMSQGYVGQGANLMMSHDQPPVLDHSSAVASGSYPLTALHSANQAMGVPGLSHQGGYHTVAAGQQEYTQQQQQQQFIGHMVELPQFTQLAVGPSSQQNQRLPDQQAQNTSQSYMTFTSQGVQNSESVVHQQTSMHDTENATGQTDQQGHASDNVNKVKCDIRPQQTDVVDDNNVPHDDMPVFLDL